MDTAVVDTNNTLKYRGEMISGTSKKSVTDGHTIPFYKMLIASKNVIHQTKNNVRNKWLMDILVRKSRVARKNFEQWDS